MNLARRLWWGLVVTVVAAVLVTGIVGWLGARHLLLERIDTHMHHRLSQQLRPPPPHRRGEGHRSRPLRGPRFADQITLRLTDADGRLIEEQGSWPADLQPELQAAPQTLAAAARLWRVHARPLSQIEATRLGQPVARWLFLAVDLAGFRADLSGVAWALVLVGSAVISGALLLAGRLRDALLAPLARLAAGIAAIDVDRLDDRLAGSDLPPELARIAARINELLTRLEAARARERRVLADIAHELRTPIAALRAELGFLPEAAPGLDDQVAQLSRRLDALLLFTRLEAGPQSLERQPCAWAELVAEAWAPHAAAAEARAQQLALVDDADAEVIGQPDLLVLLISNLLQNAIAHGRPGGAITVHCDGTGLVVRNPAEGLVPGPLTHATEAFWRAERARSDSRHAGLGLAIVARIATLHGLALSVTVDTEHQFVVRVTVARSPPEESGLAAL